MLSDRRTSFVADDEKLFNKSTGFSALSSSSPKRRRSRSSLLIPLVGGEESKREADEN